MSAYRVKCRWTGFTGAPGYTILHFDAQTAPTAAAAEAAADAAHTFIQDCASNMPSVVKLTIETAVEVIDEATNQLETIYTVPAGVPLSGTVPGGFSSATGACITWETGEVKNGRRVRGRTFLVPLAGTCYDTDGTLTSGTLTDLQNAASGIAAGGFSFGVLSRPSGPGASDGSFHTVSSGRVNDKTAILTSRRD